MTCAGHWVEYGRAAVGRLGIANSTRPSRGNAGVDADLINLGLAYRCRQQLAAAKPRT